MDDSSASLRIDTAGGSLLDDALAKREDPKKGQKRQTYRQHVTAVYRAWCGLTEEHAALIYRVADLSDITVERLLQSSLLCVALHDVGKLTTNFQDMMRAPDDESYRRTVRHNYRHEIAGLWVVKEAARALGQTRKEIPGRGLLEALAVAGHHRFVTHDAPENELFLNPISWERAPESVVESSYALAKAMFLERGWTLRLYQLQAEVVRKELSNSPEGNFPFNCLELIKDRVKHSINNASLRNLFILLKGLLMTADWIASGHKDPSAMLEVSRHFVHLGSAKLLDHVRAKVEADRRKRGDPAPFEGYRPFQEACGQADGHVLAIAPTASGKTEAACLWALRQVERGHARKIFFLLPTMVTANSLHERLKAFFSRHGLEVALVHSTADLIRDHMSRDGDEDEADRADVRAGYLSESHFFPPVVVGTVDQLLVTLFHAGRWAMKTLAAADAAIVIDEVHAYDPHTAGLIVLMIEQLRVLNARFMIMSATMPKVLQVTIRRALGTDARTNEAMQPVAFVADEENHDQARNEWSVHDVPMSSWLIVQGRRGKRNPSPEFLKLWEALNDRREPVQILIVLNTVKRCQDLSSALRALGYDPVCYHSKFIFDHRREKERLILDKPPRLLIATQVVEVSLELDYDVMLTECAAFDALVQRAGRVNRHRRRVRGRIIVFRHEEESYNIYPRAVLDASWELCRAHQAPLTERQLIELVERVYSGRTMASDLAFRDVQAAALGLQQRLSGVLDSPRPWESEVLATTRRETYPQLSVIPSMFTETVKQIEPKDRRLYELKVPTWYAKKNKVGDGESEGLPICKMRYDSIHGARLESDPKDAEHPEPGFEIY